MVTGVGGTRFKGLIMEVVGSGCLGHRELTQSLPEESAHLPSFRSLCGRHSVEGDVGPTGMIGVVVTRICTGC